MSDELGQHLALIQELSRTEVFSPKGPNASVSNPAWFTPAGKLTDDRFALHEELLAREAERFASVPRDGKAIVLAGPPGAGKTTAQIRELGDDRSNFAVVDADNFKELLLRQAMADGTFESFMKPDSVRVLEEDGHQFFPMEFASLVHEESSMLAKAVRARLIEGNVNVVLDTVLSSEAKAVEHGETLWRAGYDVRVLDVETSYDVSAARVEHRWRESRTEALNEPTDRDGKSHLGGRWVPSEFAKTVFAADGTSRPEQAARSLAETCPAVSRYQVFRLDAVDADLRLEVDFMRSTPGGALTPTPSQEQVSQTSKREDEASRSAVPVTDARSISSVLNSGGSARASGVVEAQQVRSTGMGRGPQQGYER